MTDNMTNRSPNEIESDIRATQDDMSRTVEQLGAELTGHNLFKSLLDKAGQTGIDARYLIDAAQRNPLALGMIAAGGLWLVSAADAKPSAWKTSRDTAASKDSKNHGNGALMSEGIDRANGTTSDLTQQVRNRAQQAVSGATGLYFDNPIMSGLTAAFVGAIAGSAIPATRTEEDYVGAIGEKAIGTAQTKMNQASGQARKVADNLLNKVDEKINGASAEKSESGSAQMV